MCGEIQGVERERVMEHPYLQYLRAYEERNRRKKAELLTEALGGKKPTPVILNNLEAFFEDTIAREAIVSVLDAEARKRRWGSAKR